MEIVVDKKLTELNENIRSMGSVAVLFGGGVGSAFLLHVASRVLGLQNVIAVTADSVGMPRKELNLRKQTAENIGVKHIVVKTREFMEESYLRNDIMRCSICKIIMFKSVMPYIFEKYTAIIGSCYNDLQRKNGWPESNIIVENEFNVSAPLKDVKILKSDIKKISEELGIGKLDREHASCLSTRIPLGSTITGEKIKMIESAEEILSKKGLHSAKVYHYGDLARIEVVSADFKYEKQKGLMPFIEKEFKKLGFKFVTVDIGCL